jgi:hypothetical protein
MVFRVIAGSDADQMIEILNTAPGATTPSCTSYPRHFDRPLRRQDYNAVRPRQTQTVAPAKFAAWHRQRAGDATRSSASRQSINLASEAARVMGGTAEGDRSQNLSLNKGRFFKHPLRPKKDPQISPYIQKSLLRIEAVTLTYQREKKR